MTDADLSSADLFFTNFSNADLWSTNLSSAGLGGANLAGADLAGAKLRGTTGLTQSQINQACADKDTVLPPHLSLPQPCKRDILGGLIRDKMGAPTRVRE